MSLEQFVKQEIQKELDTKQDSYDQKLREFERESSREVASLERVYTSEVERAIDSQVNLQTFKGKKSATFESSQSLNDQIDTLYIETLPEIMSSSFGTAQVKQFLAQATDSTQFTVSGKHTDLLMNILSDFKKSQIEVTPSDQLGSITYTTGDTTIEFSLEDLIHVVKTKTLSKVIACI